MKNFEEKIKENGLTVEQYEECLHDLRMKVNRLTDIDWQEIIDKYNLSMHYDTLRKASQTIFGGAFVMEYFKYKNENVDKPNEYIEELRKERQELQRKLIELIKVQPWLQYKECQQYLPCSLIAFNDAKEILQNYYYEKVRLNTADELECYMAVMLLNALLAIF